MSKCPNCGYCPHCGRSGGWISINPYTYPTYPGLTWISNGTSGSVPTTTTGQMSVPQVQIKGEE